MIAWVGLFIGCMAVAMAIAAWMLLAIHREHIDRLDERLDSLERSPPSADTAITQPIPTALPLSAEDAIDVAVDEGYLGLAEPKGDA